MRLLDLPQAVQDMLGNAFISVGHAKVLLSLKNQDQQIQLGRDIVNKGYTVRQTEKAIQKLLNPPGTGGSRQKALLPAVQEDFQRARQTIRHAGKYFRTGKPGLH